MKESIPNWIKNECKKKTKKEPECQECYNQYECTHDLARVYPKKGQTKITQI